MNSPPSTNGREQDQRVASDLRRIDQMISMHAYLRDRASRRSRTLTVGILIASTVSAVLAFSGTDDNIRILMIDASSSTWLGILGTVVFIASLVDLVVNHKSTADQHATAVGRLSELKLEYRDFSLASVEEQSEKLLYLQKRYSEVMNSTTAIPENDFNRLKARHLKKIQISKILSKFPGESVGGAKRRLKKSLKKPSQSQ